MRRFPRLWLPGLACVAALVAAAAALLPTRGQEPSPGKPPNERTVRDAQDRRVVEYRWPLGTPEHVVRLRIPAGYVWYGGEGLRAALGPGYPDPDVVGPFTTTIILEMLLPDLEPRTPQNEALFKARPASRRLKATISTNVRAKPPNRGRGIVSAMFDLRKMLAESNARREYGMGFGPKPDRWGLKHIGALGDFEPFREQWGPDDVYYTNDDPKSTAIICTSEEIREEEEEPSWKRHQFCEHLFFSDFLDANVKLFYSRRYLPGWRGLELRIESFFKTFEVIE